MSKRLPPPLAHHLSELKVRAGMSLDQIAREAGYKGRSSVQRYFEDATIETMSPSVAKKFAKALYNKGIPPIKTIDLVRLLYRDYHDINLSSEAIARLLEIDYDEDFSDWVYTGEGKNLIPIEGASKAGVWRDPSKEKSLLYTLDTSAINMSPTRDLYCIHIKDDSLNKVALSGQYAICRRYKDVKETYPNGQYVHVSNEKNGFVEETIRRVAWDEEGMKLSFYSTLPKYEEVIRYVPENETTLILGLVVAWFGRP